MLTIYPPQFIAHKIVILDTDETTDCIHGKVVEIDYTQRILILRGSNATDRIRVEVPADAWIVLPGGERIQLEDVQTGNFLTVIGDRTGDGTSGAISADLVLKHLPPPG